jgi:hypothetical protein
MKVFLSIFLCISSLSYSMEKKTSKDPHALITTELAELRFSLASTTQTIQAIKNGEVVRPSLDNALQAHARLEDRIARLTQVSLLSGKITPARLLAAFNKYKQQNEKQITRPSSEPCPLQAPQPKKKTHRRMSFEQFSALYIERSVSAPTPVLEYPSTPLTASSQTAESGALTELFSEKTESN